ncbi:uncharacterized protein LOC133296658 [Gastrolobium bilobum]|uniref:uncharacterized protein LOC133296658 n=1 Tax=Gastrolobium bilobum TaxID=150636 RepID=UPI002AB2A4FE|nr:uncharacterized protein LOC133296658 [Gastrolobium bilobum]
MAQDSQPTTKRPNHTWTAEEDKILVECLIDIGSSWKGENGFKPGFSLAIEKLMRQRIPGCTLRGIPHITSRVKLLKKQYNAIAEMIGPSGSGFGWNDAKKMIDVEREVFDDWVKSHPSAKGLFNKPFPHYDSLGTVFGKDVASGVNAEEAPESIAGLERDATLNAESGSGTAFDDYLDLTGDYIPTPCVDTTMPDITVDEVSPPSPVSTATAKKGKKRQRSEDPMVVEVVDVMKDLSQHYRKSTASIDNLVACFQHQAEGNHRRMSIVTELEKFEDLTETEMVQVAVQLGRDSNLTDVFMQCNENKRRVLVAGMLANQQ